MTGSPQRGAFLKEHMNAVLAMVTVALEARESGDTSDPVGLQVIGRVINDVPREVAAMASLHLILLLVRHLARVQGRPVDEVWQELALIYAEDWPEDDAPRA
ncbi:hypothetical protein [Nonomuraea sp. NEAU-A123]|uniref:hypothetical protein n=1 Tax=Nonomuraea sp. NEAU-A123 TaxID=2839649 RepID=UPI001BE3FD36|nr:hypothetical protein [Nonomuraea sp. NEAU-A123]MBT2228773.1 hypothetical protein [Nonomuraea sp. NEAU-A123]